MRTLFAWSALLLAPLGVLATPLADQSAIIYATHVGSSGLQFNGASDQKFSPAGSLASASYSVATSEVVLNGRSWSSLSAGRHRAYASLDWQFAPYPGQAFVSALSESWDDLTFIASPSSGLQGQPGSVVMVYDLSGTVSQSGDSASTVLFLTTLGSNLGVASRFGPSFSNMSLATTPLPIVFGEPIIYYSRLYATTGIYEFRSDGTPQLSLATGAGSGTADFGGTAILRSVLVYDGQGLEVPVSIFASSGLTYSRNGVVPEPSSLGLVAIGAALFLFASRPRKPRSE